MKNIRNFVIIAHIDHGKSTLADRFLEITKTVEKRKMKEQFLDRMDLEREKGITIKMQPVRLIYQPFADSEYILNLIDTPGHVDFSYEVSRSLAAVEGAILLVDATKGIQAQTLANLELAKKQNLVIIPAVNKIDAPNARVEETLEEITNLLNVSKEEVFLISAKCGTNVEQLLRAVIEKVPAPSARANEMSKVPQVNVLRSSSGSEKEDFQALIFDSQHDFYKGVIVFIRVFNGSVKKGQKLYLIQGKIRGEAKEVGIFKPELVSTGELKTGEIGYIATGIKESEKVRVREDKSSPLRFANACVVGDTITDLNSKSEPLSGYKESSPMVFASFYPELADQFDLLKDGLTKLKLNDASLFFEPETKDYLGRGFRCGFLGSLHAEIISERLHREFGLNLIISSPSVIYRITNKKGATFFIYSAQDWPGQEKIEKTEEPWVKMEIITPQDFLSPISDLLKSLGGIYIKKEYFSSGSLFLTYEIPFRAIIAGFYDRLKSQSQGFASINYQSIGYREANLVKLEILIAEKKQEAFSKIVSNDEAYQQGKKIVEKLKQVLPAQLFSVPLQAMVSGKIIARETMGSRGKNVIAGLYGGDYSRKRKVLEKQKKGKKALKQKGEVHISQNVFLKMFQA